MRERACVCCRWNQLLMKAHMCVHLFDCLWRRRRLLTCAPPAIKFASADAVSERPLSPAYIKFLRSTSVESCRCCDEGDWCPSETNISHAPFVAKNVQTRQADIKQFYISHSTKFMRICVNARLISKPFSASIAISNEILRCRRPRVFEFTICGRFLIQNLPLNGTRG